MVAAACQVPGDSPALHLLAWAEPGHPHGGPHFVFADPPAAHVHMPPVPGSHAHANPVADTVADDVAGQAHPDSTLVMASMLMLITSAVWLMRPRITRMDLTPHRRDGTIVRASPHRPRDAFVCTPRARYRMTAAPS
ncbi:MAG: hypothetical protein R3A10_18270 [Caldilineaceae bacterium]